MSHDSIKYPPPSPYINNHTNFSILETYYYRG